MISERMSFTLIKFIIHLRSSSNNFVEIDHFNVIYHILRKYITITYSIWPLAHLLAPSSKICRLSLKKIPFHNRLIDFVYQYGIQMFMNFSQNSKLVYSLESLLHKHVQGLRVLHFTVLPPNSTRRQLTYSLSSCQILM